MTMLKGLQPNPVSRRTPKMSYDRSVIGVSENIRLHTIPNKVNVELVTLLSLGSQTGMRPQPIYRYVLCSCTFEFYVAQSAIPLKNGRSKKLLYCRMLVLDLLASESL